MSASLIGIFVVKGARERRLRLVEERFLRLAWLEWALYAVPASMLPDFRVFASCLSLLRCVFLFPSSLVLPTVEVTWWQYVSVPTRKLLGTGIEKGGGNSPTLAFGCDRVRDTLLAHR